MIKSTNSPFGQGAIETPSSGIVPIHTLTATVNPTRADDTITTTATNIAVPSGARSLTIEHVSGERVLIKVKTAQYTADATTANKDYSITEAVGYRDWAIPTLNVEAGDFPTHISLITASSTATITVRFK
jgi:hypothetical protein